MPPTEHDISTDSLPTATPAFIASLIESAATSFEVDLAASRDCLFQAVALLRALGNQSQYSKGGPTRGALATWQTKRIIAYIETNLTGDLQGKNLADLVDLSVSHFSRAFKISIGIPPREYITRRRVDLAREMMIATNEPLSQVALECGLNDQSSLCRVFRRIVGQSPGEWRRANALGPGRPQHEPNALTDRKPRTRALWPAPSATRPLNNDTANRLRISAVARTSRADRPCADQYLDAI